MNRLAGTLALEFRRGVQVDHPEAVSAGGAGALESSRLRDAGSLTRELAEAVVGRHGTQRLAGVLHRRTGRCIVVEDADGTILAVGSHDSTVIRRIAGSPRLLVEDTASAAVQRSLDRWVALACLDGSVFGAVSLIDPDGTANELDLFCLEQAATLLSMEWYRQRSVAEAELSTWGDFLSEVLDDPDHGRVCTRARRLGFDVDGGYRAVVFRPFKPPEPDLLPAVRRAARWLGLGDCIAGVRERDVVLLLQTDVTWQKLVRVVRHDHEFPLRLGIGGRYPLDEVRRSLSEAEFALRFSDSDPSPEVVIFDELGVWSLLAQAGDKALRDLVEASIGRLLTYDREHHSELVRTLTTYLDQLASSEATAEKLFIHRNTLKYRLARAEALTGFKLNNSEQRFRLDLACRAWTVLQRLEGS